MKIIGYVCIIIGLSLLMYVAYRFFTATESIRSPIPDQQGIKVIIVTPGK